jgi:protoporphyrin/coproporphyrin ferrochelatase
MTAPVLPARTGVGVLLINLGTPDAPTPAALRRYLKEFLWDPRVVEIPRLAWWPILNGIILNLRPRRSAEKYAAIWTEEGSPLLRHTEAQAGLLQAALGEAVRVDFAMRYGNPSVAAGLDRLVAAGCEHILVVPLYPQYAASSTASALDAVYDHVRRMRNMPALRVIKHYHDDSAYIQALAASIRDYWQAHGHPEKLLMSFHGVPKFAVEKGDPYYQQCLATGALLAQALDLSAGQYQIAFQSRFGRTEWVQPYATEVLRQWGSAHCPRVDVVCPGFTSDCLETLEEIAMQERQTFLSAGGGEFHYIPCLNERAAWIEALAGLVRRHLAGWLPAPVPAA